ncbi:hypothetical protein EVJ50_12330 [Synechococcus sp. RSCCF101]|uniref:hypothetical protein n=1 Tax=Synechococcus sp. RSCCF101 TaxID=2511069 RepID=UPI00124654A6|nr:hypothetical protein [Synechococcus sp. RSCCF101]QEY32900.1 hypothetical protein EVJ50_12330 [Synechococcus sp. RSCCF101]
MAAVLAAGALAPESSAVHEYYQLPLMLFACPLIGLGWLRWQALAAARGLRRGPALLLGVWLLISLTILTIDYWRVEAPQRQPVWHSAELIQHHTAPDERIVSVTGSDPTLLYLAHRKGWLTRAGRVSPDRLQEWQEAGATHIAGSWEVQESHAPLDSGQRSELRDLLCPEGAAAPGCAAEDRSYVIPLAAAGRP